MVGCTAGNNSIRRQCECLVEEIHAAIPDDDIVDAVRAGALNDAAGAQALFDRSGTTLEELGQRAAVCAGQAG